jgi:hypothetical protein
VALLRDNVLQIVLAVAIDSVREHHCLLPEVAINFLLKRAFPGASNGEIERGRGGGDHQRKCRQQPQEKPPSHLGASNR